MIISRYLFWYPSDSIVVLFSELSVEARVATVSTISYTLSGISSVATDFSIKGYNTDSLLWKDTENIKIDLPEGQLGAHPRCHVSVCPGPNIPLQEGRDLGVNTELVNTDFCS